MWNFYLTAVSIPMLAKLLLSIIITVYIFIYIPKDKTVKWFLSYLVAYTLLDLFAFLGQTINSELATLNLQLQYLASFILSFSYLQFSYRFKVNYFKKEQKIAFYLFGSVGLVCFAAVLFYMIMKGAADYSAITIFAIFPLGCIILASIVFYRKYRLALKAKESFKNGFLAFFGLTILALCVSFSVTFEAFEIITPTQNTIIFFVFNLVIISLVTINFINYLAKKTTVLVKLVGLSLVLFITVIGLQGLIVVPNFEETRNTEKGTHSTEALAALHEQAEPYAIFLIGSVVMIIVIFPFVYNKSILRPLKTLLKGVDELNNGDLDICIPITYHDEIGSVTSHFNNMAKNLRIANDELRDYAHDLELKVNDRTQELNKKNALLEEQTHQLEEMQHFRSELFMDISHELRTPITLIAGPLKTLLEQEELSENARKHLEMSIRNSNRLKDLVEQIIDLNRLETNQLTLHTTPINVGKQLSYLAASFDSLMSFNNLVFKTNISKAQIILDLDVDKFEKIITNLITNAIKFTPPKGEISLSLTEEKQFAIIKVSDNGVGIEPDRLDIIFDRYQTSAISNIEFKQGLGVGLSITKEYVELHKAEIKVESEKGNGTTFTLKFKKSASTESNIIPSEEPSAVLSQFETVEEKSSASSKLENDGNTKENILIIEDNNDMAEYIFEILDKEGYRTSISRNGEEALEQLDIIKPDLIISDIMMPVMNGMEFLERIRQITEYQNTPTFFLSARSDLKGRLESFRLGVNDYLVKPFNADELLCRITNLIKLSKVRKANYVEISDDHSPSIDQALISNITILIEARMSNSNFNIEKLAAEVSMSRSTLYREIKRITGFSAGAFIREVRLQKAKQKLEAGLVKSLGELSYEIGFSTPSYFSKMYKARFGKSPKKYL